MVILAHPVKTPIYVQLCRLLCAVSVSQPHTRTQHTNTHTTTHTQRNHNTLEPKEHRKHQVQHRGKDWEMLYHSGALARLDLQDRLPGHVLVQCTHSLSLTHSLTHSLSHTRICRLNCRYSTHKPCFNSIFILRLDSLPLPSILQNRDHYLLYIILCTCDNNTGTDKSVPYLEWTAGGQTPAWAQGAAAQGQTPGWAQTRTGEWWSYLHIP